MTKIGYTVSSRAQFRKKLHPDFTYPQMPSACKCELSQIVWFLYIVNALYCDCYLVSNYVILYVSNVLHINCKHATLFPIFHLSDVYQLLVILNYRTIQALEYTVMS